MSGILKRTVYYSEVNGVLSFRDWAIVHTTIGDMAEPYNANTRFAPGGTDFKNYDPEDMMARIDRLERIDPWKEKATYSGGGRPLNGGVHMPRVGP